MPRIITQYEEPIPFPLHPFDEMQRIVDATPDTGEGGRFHIRSMHAWELIDDIRRLRDGERPTIIGFYTRDSREAHQLCVRDAISSCRRWTIEDSGVPELIYCPVCWRTLNTPATMTTSEFQNRAVATVAAPDRCSRCKRSHL